DDDGLRSIVRGYYAMVSEVDHHVGRILDALEDSGQAENTLVLFISDHGEWLGEHWRFGKGYPGHDATARVPLLARWPGRLDAPGRTCHDLIEAVDVAPMLLEAAAVPIEPSLQGRSFLGTLTQGQPHGRESALIEFHHARSLRTPTHLYVAHDDGREFLYDQTTPLGPYRDLAATPSCAELLGTCRRQLLARMIQAAPKRALDWTY
ncbi:MAG: sulfatase-like hydrolase/transferase, partial [Phycisphaerales bacterium]|nr:sulfatase-like hydrolase/transferase [Phycisphaerales bacterium]